MSELRHVITPLEVNHARVYAESAFLTETNDQVFPFLAFRSTLGL